jgi:hypothetical protein
MRKFTLLGAVLAGIAMLAAGGAGAQSMNPQLGEPQAVPLDFLAWIDKDTTWLERQIAALGGAVKPTIKGGILESTDLGTLKAANRIRAFAYLATKGINPPYFDLMLSTDGEAKRCVTRFPRNVVPSIRPMDFATKSFPASGADPDILKSCIVTDARKAEYSDMSRDAFRDRYFDARGLLKSEFRALNDDPAFKAKAIDEGFFLSVDGLSGLLRLDLR